MLTQTIAGIHDETAPTLLEHLAIARKQGKVEPAYVAAGEPTTILVGLDGNSAEPGEALTGAIYLEGKLLTSTPSIQGIRGDKKLDAIFVAAVVEGEHTSIDIEEKETGIRPERTITFKPDEEIPAGEELLIITQAHQLASDLLFKHSKGILKNREALSAGPKLLKLQRKASKFRKAALKKQQQG